MSNTCRSDCKAPVTRRVIADSKSGRTWTSEVCDDDDHLDATRAMMTTVGFKVRVTEYLTAETCGSNAADWCLADNGRECAIHDEDGDHRA